MISSSTIANVGSNPARYDQCLTHGSGENGFDSGNDNDNSPELLCEMMCSMRCAGERLGEVRVIRACGV